MNIQTEQQYKCNNLKRVLDNPCKEGSQYFQENDQEVVHGNYHNESDNNDKTLK